jgi:winged helix-turn-helix protein/cupin domain
LTQGGDDAVMTTPSFSPGAGLDLYRALVVGGPLTTGELAERTGFEERCVREWLGGQADRGYVTYDSKAGIFLLTPEQAAPVDGGSAFHAGEGLRQQTTLDQEINAMAGMQVKSFESPDEVRPFEGNGRADVLDIGGRVVGRTTLEPGWKWSRNVKPIAGTDSCQVSHLGYCLSGRMKVIMDDGSETEVSSGDVVAIPPGHDAEVIGDEACVFIDFGEFGEYAKRH